MAFDDGVLHEENKAYFFIVNYKIEKLPQNLAAKKTWLIIQN